MTLSIYASHTLRLVAHGEPGCRESFVGATAPRASAAGEEFFGPDPIRLKQYHPDVTKWRSPMMLGF